MNFKFVLPPKFFFGFWAEIFCAKSILTLILDVSDKFIENVRGVGFLVNDTWANRVLRYGHFGEFLEYFGEYNGQFGSD